MTQDAQDNILDVRDLRIVFEHDEGTVRALNGVDFHVSPGRSIGIVGEGGCGKTISAYSVLRILPRTARIVSGRIRFRRADGEVIDLAGLDANGKRMRSIRGGDISMIFQEPMTAFSPVHSICNQISEAIRLHHDMDRPAIRRRVVELLTLVGIADAAGRAASTIFLPSQMLSESGFST